MGNTILAKGVNHILAKRDNSAWPKGAKLSGFSINNWKRNIASCNVEFLGMIFTKVDGRYNMHAEQMDALRRKNIIYSFSTIIPQNTDLSKAAAKSRPALLEYPNSNGIRAYKTLVREILNKIEP